MFQIGVIILLLFMQTPFMTGRQRLKYVTCTNCQYNVSSIENETSLQKKKNTDNGTDKGIITNSENQAQDNHVNTCENDEEIELNQTCRNITLSTKFHSVENRGILLTNFHNNFSKDEYQLKEEGVSECYPFRESFIACEKQVIDINLTVSGDNYSIILVNGNKTIQYEFGDYNVICEGHKVVICKDFVIPTVDVGQCKISKSIIPKLYMIIRSISIIFLVLALLLHLMFPVKASHYRLIILSHIVVLLFFHLFSTARDIALQHLNNMSVTSCYLIALGMHYCLLTAFFWVNVLTFDVWKQFQMLETEAVKRPNLLFRCAYAFAIPAVIVAVTLLCDRLQLLDANYISNCCLGNVHVLFYGPASIIMVINIFFCILILFNLKQMEKQIFFQFDYVHIKAKNLVFKLIAVMAIIWTSEIYLSSKQLQEQLTPDWLLCYGISAFHGTVIFVIYACKPSVLDFIKVWFRMKLNRKRHESEDTWSY